MGEINWADNQDFIDWARRVRAHLVPALHEASYVLSILPEGSPGVKFAVELGMSVLLDKPIIIVVQPGVRVPRKVVAVADALIEWDDDPHRMAEKVRAASERVAPPEPPDWARGGAT